MPLTERQLCQRCGENMLSASCTVVVSLRERGGAGEGGIAGGKGTEMKGTFNLQELARQIHGDATGIGNKYLVRWQRARRHYCALNCI